MNSASMETRLESRSRVDGTAFAWAVVLLSGLQYLAVTMAFFPFTADDAYIVARYAENLRSGAGLVFNPGERVSALTSPLHAFVLTPLTLIGNDPLFPYKLISAAGVLATIAWSTVRLSKTVGPWTLLPVLCLTSPFVILWAVGGLETPILLITIAVMTTLAYDGVKTNKQLIAIYVLATIAFLTRFDSCVFSIPLVLYLALRWRGSLASWIAIFGCAVVAIGWLAFSEVYFGDMLPTSFYTKTPTPDWVQMQRGIIILTSFFIFSGLAWPAALVAFRTRQTLKTLRVITFERLWLFAGIFLMISYGAFAGTKHMMFSYRLFVPYLLPMALLLLSVLQSNFIEKTLLATGILASNAILAWVIFNYTLNPTLMHSASLVGLKPIGFEYAHQDLRGYADGFVAAMRRNAEDTARHWESTEPEPGRRPRVTTFAAGVLPFEFSQSYIFDSLGGYRHTCSNKWWKKSSDYIHIITPRQGSREQQLGPLYERLQLVSREVITFDGAREQLEVYYNPLPEENLQSDRVDRPCQAAASR